ncbi:type VI secretion system-associated FHA domain protein TagH [Pseudomonas sp. G2-4]|uniref:type VI secretion system-associated FHA domain protein TagH n=1 Tax=Pseudomonas sp. G2-4 TaxID=1506334 RepID=UPI0024B8CC98|nr:type VI secretion system-associated FHA domain protein TagH [Pseudomonas sp. G2-4]WHS60258.1 type VI secretion system-associated FHA domain protein TagH [Pseudomonas sp. G2-4]
MELVFEMLNARQFIAAHLCQQTFGPAGGVIGRGEGCDWALPDRQRLLSKRHAQVSFHEGSFFLTDTSGNGTTHRESGERLPNGEPVRIKDGDAYIMGDFEILARLLACPSNSAAGAGRPTPIGGLIPDDAFLALDPLKALDQRERIYPEIDELINPTAVPPDALDRSNYARVDMESLLLPELIDAPIEATRGPVSSSDAVEQPREGFWERFGSALGMDLDSLDGEAREALAINTALLAREFAQAYEEQVRLISTLHTDHHG